MEEEQLARQLGVPIEEIPAMLKDDRVESTLSDETDGVDSAGTLYKMGTIDVYCAAIAELYETQRTNGTNPHPTFRGPAFKGLLESRRRAQDRNNRDDSVDRGLQSLYDGYSLDEFRRMQECLLHGAATAAAQNLRTRLDVLAGHFFVLRGENRRKLELPDMSLLEYPREEGPTPCFALVFLLSNGKMNKTGKTQYMGAMRHRGPLLCTQGALAQYLFWRCSGDRLPNTARRCLSCLCSSRHHLYEEDACDERMWGTRS